MITAFKHRWNVKYQASDPELDKSGAVLFLKILADVVPAPLPLPLPGAYLLHPTSGDLESLAGLTQAAYGLDDGTLPALRLHLREYFSSGAQHPLLDSSWMCFMNGTPVSACLIAQPPDTKTPCLVDLMTASAWQGHGLAKAVLQKSLHALVENGFTQISLTCYDATPAVRNRLKKYGFFPARTAS